MERITVLGGGIGGLAVSLALARRGRPVRVLEQAPSLGEVGAGVQISPNGHAVLKALGLAEVLAERSVRARAVELRNRAGRRVLRLNLDGRDFHLLHRADLIGLLAASSQEAGVEIVAGAQVTGVEDGSTPQLAIGDRVEDAAFVIGADGLRSVARRALNGRDAPLFTGQVAWRAIVPGRVAPEAVVHMGPGRHLVCYPLRGGALINLVGVEARDTWTDEGWDHAAAPEGFRAAFREFSAEIRDVLERVEKVRLWGLFRHPVAARWAGRNMALLGDAAHPTLPFLAQGANLALEDAWCLAAALDEPERDAALERYQRMRAPRVERAIAAAGANARNYHLGGPAALAAHWGLRLSAHLLPGLPLRRLDWLYGHDVTGAPGSR